MYSNDNISQKIAIFGIGSFGKIFYEALGGAIDFFIDDFSDKKELFNKPILKKSSVPRDTNIYISILQHSKKIEQELIMAGFTNIVNFTQSIKCIPNILNFISQSNYLWLVEEKQRMINIKKINEFQKLLSDEKSKEILDKIVMLRKTLDTKYYIAPSDTEYFPSDIPMLSSTKEINFIDCGAYIGDTIKELMQQTSNVKSTISFEPDNTNLIKLKKQLSILSSQFPDTDFLVYPAGVYSKNDVLRFSNSGINSSASLDDSSSFEVSVVSLDTVILNSNPNFIKMDIEGAEKEAIIGATKTIKKYKPNLAICLYHKPADLWELPLLINEIEPSYEMYIRVHEDLCLSTVLYCISKEKE